LWGRREAGSGAPGQANAGIGAILLAACLLLNSAGSRPASRQAECASRSPIIKAANVKVEQAGGRAV
jgi:hypothetical protein